MPPPLSLLHKQGKTNNAAAPLSALPPPLPLSLLCKQGAINYVEAPSPLPSRVLLPSPLLHKQGATNGTEVPLSSTGEQGTADKFKAPCHCCASRGHPIAPRCYPPGICHVISVQARDYQQCQGAIINAASAHMSRGGLMEQPPLSCVTS
jgi:hypothetical protein